MDAQAFLAEIRRFSGDVQALAAAGALLRLRQSKTSADPAARKALEAFVQLALPDAIHRLNDEQADMALGYIDLLIEEAVNLLRNPDNPPGWNVDEPALLQAQGRLSRYGFRAMEALIAKVPDLAKALEGVFLDVGTGTGGFCLEATARWPRLRAVGIDIWEPGLALARENAAASDHADRIEIRNLDVRSLDEHDVYDIAWLPVAFMDRSTVESALGRLFHALRPGGYLVVGYQTLPASSVSAAYAELRIIRNGGSIWKGLDLEEQVGGHGFVEMQTTSPFDEANYIISRKPTHVGVDAP